MSGNICFIIAPVCFDLHTAIVRGANRGACVGNYISFCLFSVLYNMLRDISDEQPIKIHTLTECLFLPCIYIYLYHIIYSPVCMFLFD
jgi:hypothetical protein